MLKIAFLGPVGTHSEEAAKCLKEQAELIPYQGIAQVLLAVEKGEADKGLVPIENSLEGSVSLTLDLLAQMDLKIQREVVIPISHHLLAKKGTKLEDIEIVVSHPQAIAQCRGFLDKSLPQAKLEVTASTAEGAYKVAESNTNIAAIAGIEAAERYGLEVLVKNIQETYINETRFVLVSQQEVPRSNEESRTSMFVTISDRPGGLYQILREFALRGITLTKIESRPAKKHLGDYIFFIEFIGHYQDAVAVAALEAINAMSVTCKILGSYPVGVCKENQQEPQENSESLGLVRQEIDIIDFQIVELLAQRSALVKKVGEIKGDIGKAVKDHGREELILNRIKSLAGEKGFSPEVIEDVYKTLFSYFVNLQKTSIK